MLTVTYAQRYIKAPDDECHFAECRYADCRYGECRYAECHYAECRYGECRYAECHCAECRYAECRGAMWTGYWCLPHSKHIKGAPRGQALALPANNRRDC